MNYELFDELPGDGRTGARYPEFWALLVANPGKWAIYPGSQNVSPTQILGYRNKNGAMFEVVRREKKNYVRFVGAKA